MKKILIPIDGTERSKLSVELVKDYYKNEQVMTKSTRKGWTRMIGSVTTHVVKYAKCPVLIAPQK